MMYQTKADDLIKDVEGARILGCSRATWWRRVADGTIPQPVRIGGMTRWPMSEINALVDRAKNARPMK